MSDSKKEKKSESKKILKLKKERDEKKKEAEEYLRQLRYVKADFENYKKRVDREKSEHSKYATEKLVLEILAVVDNLERAIKTSDKSETDAKNLLEGVEITYNQLMKVLEKEGVECIRTEGEIFDPYQHECVMTEKTKDYEEDAVIQEIQKGYSMNSKVIRHSKVKIAKR
jgi:molecular chaperone GrpE